MAKRKQQQTLLTKLELEVMQVVWDATRDADGDEPITVREVVERLNRGRKKPLAYNTVQTMLTILKEKKVMSSEKGDGRAHRYRPLVSREQITTSMVGDLVDRLFDGKVQPLLVQLVGNETLDRDELKKLKRLIETQLDND